MLRQSNNCIAKMYGADDEGSSLTDHVAYAGAHLRHWAISVQTSNLAVMSPLLSRLSVVAVLLVAAIGARSANAVPGESRGVIHPNVHRRLQTNGLASIVVVMREERPSRLLTASRRQLKQTGKSSGCESGFDKRSTESTARHYEIDTSDESVESMVKELVSHSLEAHDEVIELLRSESANVSSPLNTTEAAYSSAKSLWISNEVVIRDASRDLVDKLALLPSVGLIREEAIAYIPVMTAPFYADDNNNGDDDIETRQQERRRRLGQDLIGEWSVERVHALDAWRQGWFGNGTRVAAIDSGVRMSHSVLRGNFAGELGWFDALEDSSIPEDSSGHGTGVMGVLAGGSGLGVAPGASWMACRACDATNSCKEGDLLGCAQFLTCPFITPPVTANGLSEEVSLVARNCSARPKVVNNSWNLDRGTTSFQTAIDVWVAAGIVPVFSAGNTGPSCATVSAPTDGSPTSISVGSTDYSDNLSSFSARGPGLSGNVKPDVVAPGEMIVSAGHDSDSSLALFSGTSIAAPHTSGVVALLAGAYPALTVSDIVQLLQQAASPVIGVATTSNSLCVSDVQTSSSLVVPNNAFGYGIIDVSKAIAIQESTHAATTK